MHAEEENIIALGRWDPDGFDLRAPPDDFIDNPYPYYRALRENAPIKSMPDGSYFLTRHRDLITVYKDQLTFSSDKTIEFGEKFGSGPTLEHHTTSLVFNDPPLHTQVRGILQSAMTPRAVAAMEPALIALVDRLLDKMQEKSDVDLIGDFAAAIPVEVICNLLGVPLSDRDKLRDWSAPIFRALEPIISKEEHAQADAAVTDFLAYLEDLIADRRAHLGDPETDMLTRLLLGGPSGETLSPKALKHNCIFLLNAGHETTTNLIGNGLVLLHDHVEEQRRLRADFSLLTTAINEMLRYESSNQLGNRMVVKDTSISGVDMPVGARLTLCIGAANRDPEVFVDPERFDIARKPNRHLAFGSGPHACLGLGLAIMEGRIAIGRFLDRFKDFKLTEQPQRNRRIRFRGFNRIDARLVAQ